MEGLERQRRRAFVLASDAGRALGEKGLTPTATVGWLDRLKQWARALKRDVVALWIAARDRRTPRLAKLTAAAVAAYALSPIDLIPDFVPVLGLLDDLVIVPLGVWLAVRLIPPDLMADFRRAAAQRAERPASRVGLAFILLVWGAGAAGVAWVFLARRASP